MRLKLIFSTLLLLPLSSYATLTLKNDTNEPATGHVGKLNCTNKIGNRGVIPPHGSIVVPNIAIKMYCKDGCNADIFMNATCAGESIATAVIDKNGKITTVGTHGTGHYTVSGSENALDISGSARKWYEKIFSMFS